MDETTQKGALHYLTKITEQLAWLDSWIKLAAGAGRTDINVVSETIMGGLLNKMYGWELKNTNTPKPNFPGIDLADGDRCIGIQVTSKNKLEKVNETLEKFKNNNLDKRFDKLIILLVANDNPTPGMTKAELKPWFVGSEDIWNMKRLVRELQSWEDVDRLKEIYKYLEKMLGDLPGPKDEKRYCPPVEEEEKLPAAAEEEPASAIAEEVGDDDDEDDDDSFLGLDRRALARFFSNDWAVISLALVIGLGIIGFVCSLFPLEQMPEELEDYSVTLNGTTVSVPTTFQKLEEMGWVCAESDVMDDRISPNTFRNYIGIPFSVDLTNGHGEITAFYCNPSNHTLAAGDSVIYKLRISRREYDNSYTGEHVNTLLAPYDLELGVSKRNEFTGSMVGDKEKTATTISYVFELDDSHSYIFKFNRDSKLFDGVEIVNSDAEKLRELTGPAYSAEEPQYDAAMLQNYLGVEMTLSVGGYDYPIGCTVEDYGQLGYTVDKAPEYIVSCDHGDVYIRGDAVNKLTAEAFDPFSNALVSQYCYVGCLSTEDIESTDTDFSLDCSFREQVLTISKGMPEQVLKSKLTELELEWINDGSNSVTFCPNADNKEIVVTCTFSSESREVSMISVDLCKALQTYFFDLGL